MTTNTAAKEAGSARPACRGGAGSSRCRTSSKDGFRRGANAPAAAKVGAAQLGHPHRGVKAAPSVGAAVHDAEDRAAVAVSLSNNVPHVEAVANEIQQNGFEVEEGTFACAGTDLPQAEEGEQQQQQQQQQQPQQRSQPSDQGELVSRGVETGLVPGGPAEHVHSLEQMLLHMAALNRELELELIETRRELVACKQASQHQHGHPIAAGPRRGSHNGVATSSFYPSNEGRRGYLTGKQQRGKQQLPSDNSSIRGWETTITTTTPAGIAAAAAAVAHRRGEEDAPTGEESQSRSVDEASSPERFLTTRQPRDAQPGKQRYSRGGGGGGGGGVPHPHGQKKSPTRRATAAAAAPSAARRRDISARQNNRPRGRSQPRGALDAEEVLELLETLKHSLMYRCNNSHQYPPESVRRPAAAPRRSARSVPPLPQSQPFLSPSPRHKGTAAVGVQRGRNASVRERTSEVALGSGAARRGSSRNARTTTLTAAGGVSAPAPRGRSTRGRGVHAPCLAPNTPSGKTDAERRETPAPHTAVTAGSDELEALQRRYWKQSRDILEQLDHMLADE
ncbi:LYT1p [Trypanosoma grayi]|uniref:LYT1p n=1 Tax=Trypanosoma grayi TaxID=71804 RepID=UPI0004F492FF|nr:LYT1p [Trypanosoma grayi]KEG11069.1 LYT1p [Trypanosoma grayi]